MAAGTVSGWPPVSGADQRQDQRQEALKPPEVITAADPAERLCHQPETFVATTGLMFVPSTLHSSIRIRALRKGGKPCDAAMQAYKHVLQRTRT